MSQFIMPTVRARILRIWKHVSPHLHWFMTLLELLEFVDRLATLLQHYPFC